MNYDQKRLWGKLSDSLLEILNPIGFEIMAEEYAPDYFDSGYIVLCNGKEAVRLSYNGRDYYYNLQVASPQPDKTIIEDNDWVSLFASDYFNVDWENCSDRLIVAIETACREYFSGL